MKRLPLLLAYLILCFCANAQKVDSAQANVPRCKVRFAVYQLNPHVPGGIAPGMSKEQGKWYEKNKTRYTDVCVDSEKPDYFVLWSSRFSSEGEPEPLINFGALSGTADGNPVSASGYTVSSGMESEYVYLSVFSAMDVERAAHDKTYRPTPVYYTQHDSWWTYRKSHRQAMEDTLNFLVHQIKK